ncbi:MAG: helix-turn-helix transcriptional regulator [Methylococcaceae bacterium]
MNKNKKLVQAVAATVRHFRKNSNLSQEELAAKADLDRTYISGVERGVRNITLDSLEQIINALDVDIETFFTKVKDAANELSD